MPVISPTTELGKLLGGLQALADGSHKAQMANSLGAGVLALVKQGFDNSRDPYGRSWDPVARGGMPLEDTNRMRNGFTFKATPEQVTLKNNVSYTATHQYGATIRAKDGGYLAFKMKLPSRTTSLRNGKTLKHAVKQSQWVSVREVTIHRRQMVPEGDLPELWAERLRGVADFVVHKVMGK